MAEKEPVGYTGHSPDLGHLGHNRGRSSLLGRIAGSVVRGICSARDYLNKYFAYSSDDKERPGGSK